MASAYPSDKGSPDPRYKQTTPTKSCLSPNKSERILSPSKTVSFYLSADSKSEDLQYRSSKNELKFEPPVKFSNSPQNGSPSKSSGRVGCDSEDEETKKIRKNLGKIGICLESPPRSGGKMGICQESPTRSGGKMGICQESPPRSNRSPNYSPIKDLSEPRDKEPPHFVLQNNSLTELFNTTGKMRLGPIVTPYGTFCARHLGLAAPHQTLHDVLADHEGYLQHLLNLCGVLVDVDSALTLEEKNYIGIMAACRHKCSALLNEQRGRFRMCGGKEKWLNGLSSASIKMRNLHEANVILAHRPWLFSKAHVESLIKGGMNLPEVVEALALLAHFHACSSMLHALGVEAASGDQDLDFLPVEEDGASIAGRSPRGEELNTGGFAVLLERIRTLSSSEDDPTDYDKACIGTDMGDCPSPDELEGDDRYARFSSFSPDQHYTYEDFYRRGEKSATPTHKYNRTWEEIGYSMFVRFTSCRFGDAFDDKFKIALNMTYFTCGNEQNVNTNLFRRAIWNYAQCLYGIRRDDYHYGDINSLLDRHLKLFIKTMCVAPERLASADSTEETIINGLMTSEQVHLVIIAAEARLQVEMVYAMLAVERFYM